MKTLLIMSLLLLASCSGTTQYGSCVGINDKQDSKLEYRVSIWNVAMGIVFIEMLFPPIVVVANEFYCPVGPATEASK